MQATSAGQPATCRVQHHTAKPSNCLTFQFLNPPAAFFCSPSQPTVHCPIRKRRGNVLSVVLLLLGEFHVLFARRYLMNHAWLPQDVS
jgi:hypothetical protein